MTPGADGYDGVVEVEDAGLEGGQEGVTQGAAGVQPAVKQEKTDDDSQHMQEEQQTQAASSSGQPPSSAVKDELQAGNLKEQEEVGPSGEADAQTSTASEAVFGSEIATDHDSQQQPTADRINSEPPDASQELPGLAFTDNQTPQEEEEAGPSNQQVPHTQTYIVLCREQSIVQIFALPEMQLVFSYNNVVEGPLLLTQGSSSPTPLGAEEAQTHITEACLESFGPTVVPGQPLVLVNTTLLTSVQTVTRAPALQYSESNRLSKDKTDSSVSCLHQQQANEQWCS